MCILDMPAPEAARALVGKILVRRLPDGRVIRARITETEAYFGESDTACHACHGRTQRTQVLYRPAGTIYVYLCYGIHWMLNLVTGPEDDPQAVLIRGVEGASGPGRVTKYLSIDKSLNDTPLGGGLSGGYRLRLPRGSGPALAVHGGGWGSPVDRTLFSF